MTALENFSTISDEIKRSLIAHQLRLENHTNPFANGEPSKKAQKKAFIGFTKQIT